MLGLANAAATLPGWLAPLTAGALTQGQSGVVGQWHKVFYISSSIYAFGCVVYLIFASGEVQDWNQPETKPTSEPEKQDTLLSEGSPISLPLKVET